jgi:hypothetical protein
LQVIDPADRPEQDIKLPILVQVHEPDEPLQNVVIPIVLQEPLYDELMYSVESAVVGVAVGN